VEKLSATALVSPGPEDWRTGKTGKKFADWLLQVSNFPRKCCVGWRSVPLSSPLINRPRDEPAHMAAVAAGAKYRLGFRRLNSLPNSRMHALACPRFLLRARKRQAKRGFQEEAEAGAGGGGQFPALSLLWLGLLKLEPGGISQGKSGRRPPSDNLFIATKLAFVRGQCRGRHFQGSIVI